MTTIKIYGFHADAYGHVNNARYLEFFEQGRWDFLQQFDELRIIDDNNLAFVVVNINVNFKKAIFPHQTIFINTFLKDINNASALMEQMIYNEKKEICAKAEVTFVLVNKKTNKAVMLKNDILNFLKTLQNYGKSKNF